MDSLVSGLMQGAIWMTFVLVVWGIGTIVKKKIHDRKKRIMKKKIVIKPQKKLIS